LGLVGRAGLWAVVALATSNIHPATAASALNPSAPCSVFDAAPCTPSFCGVFDPWPCVQVLPSIGDGLQITVAERMADGGRPPTKPVNSLRELHAALRNCWEPPPLETAFHGMQMSVRFSFKRTGEIIAPPRVTYINSDADSETRRIYRQAIDAALARCTPMPFSEKMGAAIAGRPMSIRFVDNRKRSAD
jgi:hypothetical protein